eukprot:CAMPEP_0194357558 /NCGR_PEP_ID=MMETSP0174-20130528/5022_1 /TAXON_ID=216777 /ORGANISM="Proboscia alata, Strain PI-D3" /LENGTH=49 /DNA_ID=CAMNT_0039127633 /DNA_START=362 /DNA_END=511 /DNA_ORIENTATION=-
MPCAAGIEDCDMPEAISIPGHGGVDDVDVFDFLNLKRAAPVSKSVEKNQ